MATFTPIPYTYTPTAPRTKSVVTCCKPAPKPISILTKIQHIKSNGAALSMPRSAAAAAAGNGNGGHRPGIRGTGSVYRGSDEENNNENDDDDRDLPTIEELLLTRLREQGVGFTTEDRGLDMMDLGVGELASEERGSPTAYTRSAQGDHSGGSLEDPIVLLGDDGSSASEADDNSICATSTALDVGLFDSPDIATNSTAPTPLSSSDGWYDIDSLPETALRLQFAKKEASTSDTIHYISPSSHPSSELLQDPSRTDDLCTGHVRFEASISDYSKASPQYKPSQAGRLLTSGSTSNEIELLRHTPGIGTDMSDKENEQQRCTENEENEESDDNENNIDEQQDCDINDRHREAHNVAAVQITKRGSDTQLPSKEDEGALPTELQKPPSSYGSFPQPAQEEGTGSYSDSSSDGEISNTCAKLDEEQRRPRPPKRKRLRSSYEGTVQKKRRHHPQQRSTQQPKPHNRPQQHYAESALPSPAPSTPQALDTELPSDLCTVSRSSKDTRPMLTEITFRPHSLYECSFTAVIRADLGGLEFSFSQVAKLIENIGYVGKIDDFTIKPLTQNSFLLVGFSGGMGPSSKASRHKDETGIQLQQSKVIDARAIAPCEGELLPTKDNDVLSDSDPDLSSSSDDGSSTEDEQGRSSIRKHSAWSPLDEQRLLVYKKEDKPWSYIFQKFPGRTQGAVRTRWSMVQAQCPGWRGDKNDEEGADVADKAKPKRRQGRPPKKK